MNCDVTDVTCSGCLNAPSHQRLVRLVDRRRLGFGSKLSGAGPPVAIDWCLISIREYSHQNTDIQCLQCIEEIREIFTLPSLETSVVQQHV